VAGPGAGASRLQHRKESLESSLVAAVGDWGEGGEVAIWEASQRILGLLLIHEGGAPAYLATPG
jgi:hypothetical protein